MKDRICLLLVLLNISLVAIAQRERNYIYLLDCTKSMTGYNGNPNIWQPTKDYLRNDLEKHTRNTTLHVIPFQDRILPGFHFQAGNLDWKGMEKTIDGYVDKPTDTNICAAWDEIDRYIDKHRDNYIILLTDGQDNVNGMETLANKLRNWCGRHPNTYAFYVLLTEAAKAAVDRKVRDVIDICDNEFMVDATKGGIPVFGSFDKGLVVYTNTLNLKKMHKLKFSSAGEYAATAVCDDPYFDVKIAGGKIKDGIVSVKVEPRKSVAEINAAIPEKYEFSFDVRSEKIRIINPTVKVCMTNKPERTLDMLSEETSIGKASWYDSFLFWGASTPEKLDIDLKTVFNDEAMKDGSVVELSVDDADGVKDFQLMYNGNVTNDGRIVLSAKDNAQSILSVVFDPDAREGTRYLMAKVVARNNLDKINDQPAEQYTLTLRAGYSVVWNPLKVILMWIGIIILAALLLWFVMLKRIIYPAIGVKTIQINDPYFSKVNVKGKRRVVFTDKTMHQGLLNKVFTGEILYKKNDIWTSPLAFEAGSKKRTLHVMRTKDYAFIPQTSSLKAPGDYVVENCTDNQKISMTIN